MLDAARPWRLVELGLISHPDAARAGKNAQAKRSRTMMAPRSSPDARQMAKMRVSVSIAAALMQSAINQEYGHGCRRDGSN
jgi:hypothetical protein